MLTLAFEGFLYWRRQTAGRLSWPLRASDRWALASRGVALGLLAWALTQPQFTRWLDRQNVFFVLDMSDSVSLAGRETAYRWATIGARGHEGRRPCRAHHLRRGPAAGRAAPADADLRPPAAAARSGG